MKKILSILLAACLLASMGIILSSCGHQCNFATEWSKDETSHWHKCTGEECTEIADKADHTWNEGEITTPPTQEADGVKAFTCTVCAQTKTESVAFAGMTEAEWNAAFDVEMFENFMFTYELTDSSPNDLNHANFVYKFTNDTAWYQMIVWGQPYEEFLSTKEKVENQRNHIMNLIEDVSSFDNFKYDVETKTYKATSAITIKDVNVDTTDATITFADGKLAKVEYSALALGGEGVVLTTVMTFSEYGTVVLNP